MPEIIFFGDIVEKNGKTIKENNLALQHKYAIGSIVEFQEGDRLHVLAHSRDCDGSPLYELGLLWDKESLGAYGEDSLKLAELT